MARLRSKATKFRAAEGRREKVNVKKTEKSETS
jgi:hypothetical protein